MSVLDTLGPFSAVYVGDATSSEPLTLIDAIRTRGSIFKYSQSMRPISTLKARRPAGTPKIVFDLTFYHADSDIISKLALGASLDSTNVDRADKPGGKTQYTIVAVHVNPDIKMSLYIPVCETERQYDVPTGKRLPEFTLTFTCDWERNSHIQQFYKDTASVVAAMVTNSRNPLT